MDKFVSAGGQKPAGSNGADAEQRNEALNSIRQQIEDSRARQRELAAQGPQKSLYEVLQENRGLSILPFSNNLPKKKEILPWFSISIIFYWPESASLLSSFHACLLKFFVAKKQAEYEEEYTQRNAIHRLDNDEIDYLEGLLAKERVAEAQIKQEVTRGLDAFKQKRQAEELGDLNDKSAATAEAAAMTAATVTFVPTKRRKRTVGNAKNNIVVSNAAKKDAVTTTSTKSKTAVETSKKAASPKLPKPSTVSATAKPGTALAPAAKSDASSPAKKETAKPTGGILGLQYSDDDSD